MIIHMARTANVGDNSGSERQLGVSSSGVLEGCVNLTALMSEPRGLYTLSADVSESTPISTH